jgi:hypothetical protein
VFTVHPLPSYLENIHLVMPVLKVSKQIRKLSFFRYNGNLPTTP